MGESFAFEVKEPIDGHHRILIVILGVISKSNAYPRVGRIKRRFIRSSKIGQLEYNLENEIQWTPLNRATSGPTLFATNKRREQLSRGLIK